MLCPMKVNSNTIVLIVHTSCYWVLDLDSVLYVLVAFQSWGKIEWLFSETLIGKRAREVKQGGQKPIGKQATHPKQ